LEIAMNLRTLSLRGAVMVGTLGVCNQAQATEGFGPVWYWPEEFPFVAGFILTCGLLAGVLERPFYSWAGVGRSAFRLSVVANFLSASLVGFWLHRIEWWTLLQTLPVSLFAAIFFAFAIEHMFLRWGIGCKVEAGWLMLGNVVSTLVLIALLIAVRNDTGRRAFRTLRHFEMEMNWSAFLFSSAVIVACFSSLLIKRR